MTAGIWILESLHEDARLEFERAQRAWHEAHEELWCTCGHSVEEHPRKKECKADDCSCIAYEPDDREESAEQYP